MIESKYCYMKYWIWCTVQEFSKGQSLDDLQEQRATLACNMTIVSVVMSTANI
jgi:hypothetical protein